MAHNTEPHEPATPFSQENLRKFFENARQGLLESGTPVTTENDMVVRFYFSPMELFRLQVKDINSVTFEYLPSFDVALPEVLTVMVEKRIYVPEKSTDYKHKITLLLEQNDESITISEFTELIDDNSGRPVTLSDGPAGRINNIMSVGAFLDHLGHAVTLPDDDFEQVVSLVKYI